MCIQTWIFAVHTFLYNFTIIYVLKNQVTARVKWSKGLSKKLQHRCKTCSEFLLRAVFKEASVLACWTKESKVARHHASYSSHIMRNKHTLMTLTWEVLAWCYTNLLKDVSSKNSFLHFKYTCSPSFSVLSLPSYLSIISYALRNLWDSNSFLGARHVWSKPGWGICHLMLSIFLLHSAWILCLFQSQDLKLTSVGKSADMCMIAFK